MGHDIPIALLSERAAGGVSRAIGNVPEDQEARGDAPSRPRSGVPGKELLNHERAYKEPGAFLKALLLHLDSEERRQWQDDLTKVEREEKCIRRAVFLAVVLFMLSVAGLGYCAVLLPEVFRNPSHLLMRSLSVLGIGSLISQVVFLGYLVWHRAEVTRLHEECRRLVLALARSQLEGSADPRAPGHLEARSASPFPESPTPQAGRTAPEPLSQEVSWSRS